MDPALKAYKENLEPQVMLTKALVSAIFYAKANYYSGFKTISDLAYDALEEALKEMCPNHPILTHAVGKVGDKYLLGIVDTGFLLSNRKFYLPHGEEVDPFAVLTDMAHQWHSKRVQ